MTRNARSWLSRAVVAMLGLAGAPALAEDATLGFERTPPRLSFTDGEVSYWRPGASDWTDARVNTALAAGDELSTGPGANLELQVGSRAWVRGGEATQLGLTSLEPDFLQLKLTTGTAALDLRELAGGQTLEIDTPNAAFTIERPGFYRVEVANDATTFVTRRGGRATVATTGGLPTAIEANEQLVVTGTDAAVLASQGAPALDDWDRWNYSRSDQQANPASARYVPAGVYGAGDLDQYGAWQRVPTYGAVWVPRVAVGWTPYSTGSWVADPYYGWTWVDDAPWGWAPFHYGRWVSVGGTWAWSPGPRVVRAYYSPALVAFYGSSNFSIGVSFGGAPYAGWVALGWGEPVVPWWGPRGCRGQARWAGWGGPRYVNNVEINHYTTVNVNGIHRYAHADRKGAFVAVDRNRFGHDNVRDARVSRFDRSQLQPIGGRDMGARSDRSQRVSAERRREGPAREVRERRVVTRRDTLEPGMRDASRARGREATRPRSGSGSEEARGLRARERGFDRGSGRSANESRLRQDRPARSERNVPPPTRMARAETSQQRRSVSERAPASRRNAAGSVRERERTSRAPAAPASRSRESNTTRTQDRTSRRERGAERGATVPPRDSRMRAPGNDRRAVQGASPRSTREASPSTPRSQRSSPRAENRDRSRAERATPPRRDPAAAPRERRQAPRVSERSAERPSSPFEGAAPRERREAPRERREAPRLSERPAERPSRSFEGSAPRPQRFEQPARSERRERSAPRERQREAAPQAAPAPSGAGQGQPRNSGDGGRRGGEGRRSQRSRG